MKRKDLQAGTEYAYKAGHYAGAKRVRVVDTDAVHRVDNSYGYRHGKSTNKDGIRVSIADGYSFDYFAVKRIGDIEYMEAKTGIAEGTGYGNHTIVDLYDGLAEDGAEIYRVLPRYIVSTWAAHAAQEAAAKTQRQRSHDAKVERMGALEAIYEDLPERYKEFIGFTRHRDNSGDGFGLPSYRLQSLVEFLIKENQT